MINITGSIIGANLIINSVLTVGPLYSLSVPVYNQENIVSITDETNTTYPIYVGSTSPLTAGYIGPDQSVYFSFNGTFCQIVPRNSYVQVYANVTEEGSSISLMPGFSGSNLTTTGSMSSGSAVLTLESAIDFVNGQGIIVEGAGVSGVDLTQVSISGGGGSTTLVLSAPAQTTVTGAVVHHDDTAVLQTAINSYPVVDIPASTPQISGTLTVPENSKLKGQGRNQTVLEWYKSSSTGAVGAVDWMIAGPNANDVELRGFGLTGPGFKGPSGGGIFLGNLDTSSNNIIIEDVKVSQMPATCYQLETPILSKLSNCLAESFGGTGFQLSNGTSTVLQATYALNAYYGAGYDLTDCAYMTFVSTACDNSAVAYDLQNNRGVTFCGCGSEIPSYASSAYPGLHYRFDGDTSITIIDPYTSGFAYTAGVAGSNVFYVLSNGASVDVVKGETNSNPHSGAASETYIVDATSKLHFTNPYFLGPAAGEGTVAAGGVVSVQVSTWESLVGTTSGAITYIMPEQGNGIKEVKLYANGYSNTSGTAQEVTFPVSFQNTPSIVFNSTGMSITVTASSVTFPATVSTPSSGMIILEGV